MKIAITDGHVICPTRKLDKKLDLYIANGKIIALDKKPSDFHADISLDASSYIISPGFIDLYTNLGELTYSAHPNIFTETKAAAFGGFTTVTLQPETDRMIDQPAMVEFIKAQEKLANFVKIIPIGALTKQLCGEQLTEYGALKAHGCPLVSPGNSSMANTHLLRLCFEYALTHDLTVFITAKDPWISPRGSIHEGELSTSLGLPASPSCSESIALARYLALAELTQAKIHFNKISTAKGVACIREAKQRGLNISASVALHHLWFTYKNLENFNTSFHLDPPLREESDRQALIAGLKDGTLDVVVSDHCPSTNDEKQRPFIEARAGMVSYPTFLPFALALQHEGLTLTTILEKLTTMPHKILNLRAVKAEIAVDVLANLCIFSKDKKWQLTTEHLSNPQLHSPFLGQTFTGCVMYTLKEGQIMVKNNEQTN